MRQPDARTFLFDVLRACQNIIGFTSGLNLEDYAADVKTRSAVERQFEIVGEAIGQMLKLFPEMQEEFPEASRIISFRNYLIHGYASVSNEVVWGILQGDLPALADRVAELLARGEAS
ncbi:MAG: DUF86 domain-containing protein [Acidobacteria bacterium]|nr:DUF86 domain-containing protein [Acidobacteriota bacterium]